MEILACGTFQPASKCFRVQHASEEKNWGMKSYTGTPVLCRRIELDEHIGLISPLQDSGDRHSIAITLLPHLGAVGHMPKTLVDD